MKLLETSSAPSPTGAAGAGITGWAPLEGSHTVTVLVAKRPGYEIPSLEQVREAINSEVNPSINKGYRDGSYGKFGFNGDAVMCETADYGCSFISYTDKMKCPGGKGGQHKMYLIPGCSGGSAQLNGKLSWVGGVSPRVMVHELGHNLGLMHAVYKETPDSYPDQYGDRDSVMGSGPYNRFNLVNKLYMGWLSTNDLKYINAFDPNTPKNIDSYAGALENFPPSTYKHGLRISPVGDNNWYPPSPDSFFLLSYLKDGAYAGHTVRVGGPINRGANTLGGSLLDLILTEGVPYTDPTDVPYTLTQKSHDNEKALINIIIPEIPETKPNWCDDPDGGINTKVRVTTCDPYRCETDNCQITVNDVVNEFYCKVDPEDDILKVHLATVECGPGEICSGGACVPINPQTEVCNDLDGKDYTVKGTSTGTTTAGYKYTAENPFIDNCYPADNYPKVVEGFCNGQGLLDFVIGKCPSGKVCIGGACK